MRKHSMIVVVLLLVASAGRPGAQSNTTAKPVRFEVQFSKPLAIYHYVRQISPRARANPYKTQFLASAFATESALALLKTLEAIPTDYEYKFPHYPEGKIEGSTWYVLKRNLVLASSLDDFRTRSIALIPSADLNQLVGILRTFTPVYDALIYEPNRETVDRQLRDVERFLAEKKAEELFERIRAFYRASWDSSIPFVFVFYPRPFQGGFQATAYGNISESELPTSMTEYTGILTVMLHEAAHILLDEQSSEVAAEMDRWYETSPARSSQYAKGLMQEAWATAVSNGFIREHLTGTLNQGSWYNEKYINQMAKEVLPLIRPYLAAGKPLDKALVDAYVDIYERSFLPWLSEWDNLMRGRAVVSERPEDFDLLDRTFPYRNGQRYLKDFSDSSLGQLRDSRMTKLIIISRDNPSTLGRVQQFFPELKAWKPDPTADFTYAVMANDKTRLIIVNLVKGTLEVQLRTPLPPVR